MSYENTLREEYLGKSVTVRMMDIADNSELDWTPAGEDGNAGNGTIVLTYDDKDDDPKTNIQSSLWFAVDDDNKIADLKIRVSISSAKEEVPDDPDPEKYWTAFDLYHARNFLNDMIR